MKTVVVKDKDELIKYRKDILDLFFETYGEKLPSEVWEWAYINNPFGTPYVALAFDSEMVAHYAVIPYPVSDSSGNKFHSFLSMTTMVAPSHRKHGLFTKLATATYDELKKDGADFVMGFPNQLSAPGFRKRLDWEILDPDFVVSISKSELERLADLDGTVEFTDSSRLFADLSDSEVRNWRLSKPGVSYTWYDGVVLKEYKGELDIIYYDNWRALKKVPIASAYNILLPADIVSEKHRVCFEYTFGGVGLNKNFNPNLVRRQMCLSDVF